MYYVGLVYLSIFISQHIPVVLQLELTPLPELQKEHSCIHTHDKYSIIRDSPTKEIRRYMNI